MSGISDDELRGMAAGRHVFSHKDGLALATELLAARAKLEAAERLADDMEYIAGATDIEGFEPGMWAINRARSSVAAWKAAQ